MGDCTQKLQATVSAAVESWQTGFNSLAYRSARSIFSWADGCSTRCDLFNLVPRCQVSRCQSPQFWWSRDVRFSVAPFEIHAVHSQFQYLKVYGITESERHTATVWTTLTWRSRCFRTSARNAGTIFQHGSQSQTSSFIVDFHLTPWNRADF